MVSTKLCFRLAVSFICFSCYLYLLCNTALFVAHQLNHRRSSRSRLTASAVDKKNILVLNMTWNFGLGKRQALLDSCPLVSKCFITKDWGYLRNITFDAFVIHAPKVNAPWILPKRTADQIFVFFALEPPQLMPNQTGFESYYNWTMSYKSDSDFVLQYGRIEPLPGAPETEKQALNMIEQAGSSIQVAHGKIKLAAWLVSNCNAPSNRHLYVQELQNHIQVDIFSRSKCYGGTDACPRSKECFHRIEKEYKFYLSFENSICDEYVTEKFFDMMRRNIVPIVLGGANYSALAPPHSYINALDYKPKDLADYLKKLDANNSLYAQYFWWKPYYTVGTFGKMNQDAFCKLCTALHETPLKKKTVKDLHNWYVEQSHCRNQSSY